MSQKLYEGMFLFDSNLASRDWPGLERHVQEILQKHAAELVHSERWPDRKLAYEIKGCRKGTYFLTYFKAGPQAIAAIERDCNLSDRILRVLVLYDKELVNDCDRRVRREISGPPEAMLEGLEESRFSRDSVDDGPRRYRRRDDESEKAPAALAAADEPAGDRPPRGVSPPEE